MQVCTLHVTVVGGYMCTSVDRLHFGRASPMPPPMPLK